MMSFRFSIRLAGLILGAFCLLPVSQPVSAELLAEEDSRARVSEYLQALGSYSARFSQTVTDRDGKVREQSTGRFWLARPDRFRWQYESPWPQLILTDGERIWLYDEDLEQVTVRFMDDLLARTPAGLLAGNTQMLDDYRISERETDEGLEVKLTPLAGRAEFTYIELHFVNERLAGMRLEDQLGQLTSIEFSAVELNPTLEEDLFRFTVPVGVDVVDETA
jgi:outer membrane lipoprotein carrier protein